MSGNRFLDQLSHASGRYGVVGTVAVTAFAAVSVAACAVLAVVVWQRGNSPVATWVPAALLSAGLVVIAVLLWHMTRRAAGYLEQADQARASEQQLHAAYQQLADAVDAIPAGLALYDENERLVLYNATVPTGIQRLEDLKGPLAGITFEELVNGIISLFQVRDPDLDLERWKADVLRRFRERAPVDEVLASTGHIIRMSHVAVPGGGVLQVWMDITDLKRSEAVARAAQKRFDTLVGSLADTVFSADRKGRINYRGGGRTSLLGYSLEETLGWAPREVFHPDDLPQLDRAMASLGQNRGKPVTLAFRGIAKDGTVRHLEMRMTAPKAEDNLGGELAITGTIRDIQAQHEMAERLRYELQRLNSVVQSTGAHIMLVDRAMRIIMVNNGFLDLVPGKSAEDFIGHLMYDVLASPVDRAVFATWFDAKPSEAIKGIKYEKIFTDHAGRQRIHHITANPVRDDQGQVQHIVFLAVEETERRAAELQLFAASRLATLGEMASGVAHEINQPLTIIRFGVENLLEHLQELSPQTTLAEVSTLIDEKLSRIVAQTERAATIIRDLKGFARKSDEVPGPFDVSEAIDAAADLLREQLRMSRVALSLDLASGCPPVLGNSGRLQQVVMNLILNARDAIQDRPASSGGGTIRLRTWFAAPDGKVVATVEDDGPGIPDTVLPRVFEPFFTTKPTGKGTGLGLSVSYQIIRQMGGTIAAENRAEGGARFTVTLDAAPADTTEGASPVDVPSSAAA
ncbi:MAG TPA: ATP-binding protein [Vineibacter sp.]|nr:ATP-binding protein [Vineibacter sp.]